MLIDPPTSRRVGLNEISQGKFLKMLIYVYIYIYFFNHNNLDFSVLIILCFLKTWFLHAQREDASMKQLIINAFVLNSLAAIILGLDVKALAYVKSIVSGTDAI